MTPDQNNESYSPTKLTAFFAATGLLSALSFIDGAKDYQLAIAGGLIVGIMVFVVTWIVWRVQR